MKKIRPKEKLSKAIILLEIIRKEELNSFRRQLLLTSESLKPVNLIKSTIREFTNSVDLNNNIGSAAIGMVSEYLVKNILFRATRNPLKIIAGILLQTFVTNVATKNSDKIKESAKSILNSVTSRMKSENKSFSESEIYE